MGIGRHFPGGGGCRSVSPRLCVRMQLSLLPCFPCTGSRLHAIVRSNLMMHACIHEQSVACFFYAHPPILAVLLSFIARMRLGVKAKELKEHMPPHAHPSRATTLQPTINRLSALGHNKQILPLDRAPEKRLLHERQEFFMVV